MPNHVQSYSTKRGDAIPCPTGFAIHIRQGEKKPKKTPELAHLLHGELV